ncbi:hypothetical protein HED34_10690 [Vagococcus fluvialis]|uniref:MazG-like family protein n=1 Tax=Vagococcus fluvialis TaxID=2738 RepID=UPI001432885B|nr:MazG-like family protein [Vagococcus fluvialis]NKC60423.1 hypothetical protein [Vagococcus fluvialis]NKD51206.1 hypothetical protein [Vagococcus fluvialis]
MSDLKKYQKLVYENKVQKGFNVANIETEFLLIYGEIAEAFEAYKKNEMANLGEELAEVAIYLLGLSEILGIDLDEEIAKKIEINQNRKYISGTNGYMKKK